MSDFLQTPAVETQMHMFNQLAAIFARDSFDGIEDETDNTLAELLAKTLNTHYTVRETVVPNSFEQPRLRYFGIGIDGTLSNGTVRIPKSNNGWLYHPIPIRVMTLADEALLDAEVRALYRMRNTVTVSGTTYVQYWLKVIDWEDITAVQTQQITAGANPTSHILDIDMTPAYDGEDYIDDNEEVDDTTQIVAAIPGLLEITYAEVAEAFSILPSLSGVDVHINEIGICTGIDREVEGDPTEAIFTHLAFHRCSTGFDLTPGGFRREQIMIESGNLALL